MRKLLIQIEDDIYDQLRSQMGVKHMCGSIAGVEDTFVCMILAMEKGETKIHLAVPKKVSDKNVKK